MGRGRRDGVSLARAQALTGHLRGERKERGGEGGRGGGVHAAIDHVCKQMYVLSNQPIFLAPCVIFLDNLLFLFTENRGRPSFSPISIRTRNKISYRKQTKTQEAI